MTEAQLQLIEQFVRTARLFHRYRLRNWCGGAPIADTSRGQGRVLALLNIQPEMSQKDLGYLLGIRNQSISELVAKLEKAGYVTKAPSENDKRVVNVTLTEKGKKAANKTDTQTADHTEIFDCLSSDEQTTLNEYLDRINAELEKELGEDGVFPTDWHSASPEYLRSLFEKFHEQGDACGYEDFMGNRDDSQIPDWKAMHDQMLKRFGRNPHDFGRHFAENMPHSRHPEATPTNTQSSQNASEKHE